ncbi:MAG TPA: fumarylacetoacetate hydrolase family protein [Polyangiales bacterium]|nr:fumarylacetoacetate hydrolase family protein [Polyangiales bacterium]
MRILRIQQPNGPAYAQLDGDQLALFDAAPWLGGKLSGQRIVADGVRSLAPVEPSKVVCLGRNYAAHAKELGNDVPSEPLLFLKPPSSLVAPGAAIKLPAASQRVEHEAEIGVVIGQRTKNVSPAQALESIFGITAINDVTARDLQRKDVQFTRGKGFDTFCPVGPWIETDVELDALEVRGHVNGELRQQGHVNQMVFSIATQISFISHIMTLEPGDLIATGTPEGVGPLLAGDTVEITVTGVGTLRNSVEVGD